MSPHLDHLWRLLREVDRERRLILDQIFHHHRHHAVQSRFTFLINNFKFSSMSNSQITVPSGTPVNGFNSPLDAKDNVLKDTAYLAGSCKYGVIPGPSGNAPGFTLTAGATEEDFGDVVETVPGAASDGIITFDAKDINGKDLAQSQGTLIFTAVVPLAVGSQFNFNQTSH